MDEHLRRLDAELRLVAADRDAAAGQASQLAYELDTARTEAENLRDELTTIAKTPMSVEGMSERLQRMLRLAQDEVVEMRNQANNDAAAIIAEADEHGRRGRAELAELRVELEKDRAAAMAEVERTRITFEQEQARVEEQAKAKRAEAEEDFVITMAARRKEVMAELTATTTAARADAAAMRDQAAKDSADRIAQTDETVRRRLADAQRDVDDLRSLRNRIAEQLRSMQAVLNRAGPALEPLAMERLVGKPEPHTAGRPARLHRSGQPEPRHPAPLRRNDADGLDAAALGLRAHVVLCARATAARRARQAREDGEG